MAHGVVVVDDAQDLRRLVVLALNRDERLEVRADVSDGQQGVEAVRRHRPDVVLMDVSMPVMDGLSATRQIKQEFPDLPVVIFTGYGDERLADEATKAGADAFMEKTRPLPDVVEVLVRMAAGT